MQFLIYLFAVFCRFLITFQAFSLSFLQFLTQFSEVFTQFPVISHSVFSIFSCSFQQLLSQFLYLRFNECFELKYCTLVLYIFPISCNITVYLSPLCFFSLSYYSFSDILPKTSRYIRKVPHT